MSARRAALLPPSLAPLGLSRSQAAAFVGVGEALFDRLVEEGRMPQPRMPSGKRLVWDLEELVAAFRQLPHRGEEELAGRPEKVNPWD